MRVPGSKPDPTDGRVNEPKEIPVLEPVTVQPRQLDLSDLATDDTARSLMFKAAIEDAVDGVNLAISYGMPKRVEYHLEVARAAVLDAQAALLEVTQ